MTASSPSGSRRRILVGLTTSLLVVVLLVVGAEAFHRYGYYGWAGFSPVRLASDRQLGDLGYCETSALPNIRYKLKPDVRGWHKLYPFETSSLGLRDHEYTVEKPEGTFRIAVVGDSFTMGWGVPLEDVFHSVVEERLAERPGATPCELLNFGVAGYSLLHYSAVVEHVLPPYEPDLILLALGSNDVSPPGIGHFEPQGSGVPPEVLPPPPFLRLTLLEHLLPEKRPARRGDEDRPRRSVDPEEVERKAAERRAMGLGLPAGSRATEAEYVEGLLRRIRETAEEAGARVFCVFLAIPGPDRSARVFREATERVGLPYLDTTPLFRERTRDEVTILPNDAHPNIRAHAIYADAVEEALLSGDWLPD